MIEIAPIGSVTLESAAPLLNRLGMEALPTASAQTGASFASILRSGLESVNDKIATADGLVRQFALDDSIPVHQVTFALEEARLSVEFAMQVRQRLTETYRELMNMQL